MSEILVIVWCQQRCQIVSREEHGTVSWANPGNVSPPYGPPRVQAQLPWMALFPVLTSVPPPTVTWRFLPVSFLSLGLGEVEGGKGTRGSVVGLEPYSLFQSP